MRYPFWLKFRLIFVVGGFFAVFLFLPQPAAACSNKVIFRDKVMDEMLASAPFEPWQAWLPAAGYNHPNELLQDCFDDGLPEVIFRLTTPTTSSSVAALSSSQAYLFAHISPDGRMDAQEANNVFVLGSQADVLLKSASLQPRFVEFLSQTTGGSATPAPLFITNASTRDQATVQVPAGFSGIYYGQHPFRSSQQFNEAPQYLAYDVFGGALFYQLSLTHDWEQFPEIVRVKDLYTQATQAITANCDMNFTEGDMIRGVIPTHPGQPWEFQVRVTSDDCPNIFSTDFNSVDYADYDITDLAALTFSSAANVEPAPDSADPQNHFSAPVRVVSSSVYTSFTLNQTVFGHFLNILVILIMISGGVIFAGWLHHYAFTFDEPRRKQTAASDHKKSPHKHSA